MPSRFPQIEILAAHMHCKLRENEIKGDWTGETVEYLLRRLKEELEELEDAVHVWGHQIGVEGEDECAARVTDEAADVANLAMMVADVCGGVNWPNERKG